jgi:asparagine synthase (glutamine-hydrolysing)
LREASHLGMRSVLTGEIADSGVRGSPLVFDSLIKAGRWGHAWHYLRAYRSLSRDSWRKIMTLYAVAPLLPLPLHRQLAMLYERRAHARVRRHLVPWWMPEPLREALSARHLELLLAEEGGRRTSSESRHWDLLGLSPPEAMALPAGWPIQLARPYADRRLQEFLLAVPPPEKFEPDPVARNGYAGSKQLLRRGLVGIMPERIRTRTSQTHFASAVVDRLRHQWPTLASWFGPGGDARIAERELVDPVQFWERLRQMHDGQLGPDCLYLGYFLGLEVWLRTLEQPRQQSTTVKTSWTDSRGHHQTDRALLTTASGVTL